jgi:membrane glycosyltransferase
MPDERPLAMPVQSLSHWSETDRRRFEQKHDAPWAARFFVFGGALFLTLYGAWEMYQVVSVSRTTFLQWVLLALFTVNFSWIALAFTSAILGFSVLLQRSLASDPSSVLPTSLRTRTAIVMPVYNEMTARTFAALEAIRESVEATGLGEAFDYFVLSDSTQGNAWIAEERAFLAWRNSLPDSARGKVWYRHRPKNHQRKAGNIADFVSRWGGHYDHILVLDADSVMSGDCIARLAHAMENDPDAGIIQTLPLIINRNTLFARVQQFAARIYGPVIACGLSRWMGHDGNYWGHNAIIRMQAFAAHAGLPDLRGKPPLGGHILSHDFVEAALIRRAGYTVYMLEDLEGSYEESPPSLIDLAARDRRWCQGNLQHVQVIGARGLTLATRQHFATGIMSYLASPFWLFQLIVGTVLVFQTRYLRPEYFTAEFSLFPNWPRFDPERALALFGLTMGILLAPKVFGLLLAIFDRKTCKACGGALKLTLSALLETLLSALIAPVMMLIQSGSVFQILLGRDTGWQPQRRDDGSIPLADIIRRHRWHVVLGLITGLSAFLIATSLFLWMSPTILGLVLAIPLSWMSGKLALGLFLKRHGLLLTPEEKFVPPVAARANALQERYGQNGFDDEDALQVLHHDSRFLEHHIAMLPDAPSRPRGSFTQDHVMAQAKLVEAQTLHEAQDWLTAKERMITLHDRALLDLLRRLDSQKRSGPDRLDTN